MVEDVERDTFRFVAPDNAKDAWSLYEKIYDLYARLSIQSDDIKARDEYLKFLEDNTGVIKQEVRSIREKMFIPAPLNMFFDSAVNDLNSLYSILENLGGDFDNIENTREIVYDYRATLDEKAMVMWYKGYLAL